MTIKKELSIEELEKQCLEAEKNFKTLREQYAQAKKAEEEEQRAKLEAERQKRYDAVVNAYEKFEELRTKYVDDYGSFTFKATKEDEDLYDWATRILGVF